MISKGEIEEAGAGNLNFSDSLQIEFFNHGCRQFARIGFQPLGGSHDAVGLVVPKFWFAGDTNNARRIDCPGRTERFADQRFKQVTNVCYGHAASPSE